MTDFLEKTGFEKTGFEKTGLPPNPGIDFQNLKIHKKTCVEKGRFWGSPKKHLPNPGIDFQKFLKKTNWFILSKKQNRKK